MRKFFHRQVLSFCPSNIKDYKTYSNAPSWKEERVRLIQHLTQESKDKVLEEMNSFFLSKMMSNVKMSLVLPCTYYYFLSPWIFQSHHNCYCNVKFHVDFTELKETISFAHCTYITLPIVFTSSIRQLSFMVPLVSCIFFK